MLEILEARNAAVSSGRESDLIIISSSAQRRIIRAGDVPEQLSSGSFGELLAADPTQEAEQLAFRKG
jgi:hypothetical protein